MTSLTAIKKDFPIFTHHPGLIYLDSAATSQKPKAVIDAERKFYEEYNANIHRGIYDLSLQATDAYEGAREKVRQFINAKSIHEIVFTRNTTEAINLIALTYGQRLGTGDVILLSEMEHHSNILPWQKLQQEQGVELRWWPVTDQGDLDFTALPGLLDSKVKLVAVTQMSNVLGTVNDIKTITAKAHEVGALVLVDAAQSVPHLAVDVQDLDADFLVFSGHKMLGPTGIGVLFTKEKILADLPPFLRGGDMILEVSKEAAIWNSLPHRFEAGTPNIAGAIGLGAAIDYLTGLGLDNIWQHEQALVKYGLEKLGKLSGVQIMGAGAGQLGSGSLGRGAIFALTLTGVHAHDIGSILNDLTIAIRAGHHCAMPLHQRYNVLASARASFYLYNTKAEIDALVNGIKKIQEIFA